MIIDKIRDKITVILVLEISKRIALKSFERKVSPVRMYDCIMKKKLGQELTGQEINYIVDGFTKDLIPDYQMSAFLMAVCLKKMTKNETLALTKAMAESGDLLDLSAIHGKTADKHSTGGVGDKTTLIVGPIAAALGVPVAKMSGRGLGHTGGTIDKLESFPGFRVDLSEKEFFRQVNESKLAVIAQTANLAPADKKIYALRDVTATVDSMSLIASSIMSKKLASGAQVIVLDVKTGSGAFMKTLADSISLAEEMVDIGNGAGRDTFAVVTDMNQPLGYEIGNILEVKEAIMTLCNNGPEDLKDASCTLAALMLTGAGKAADYEEGYALAERAIEDGSAYRKFIEFIKAQHGDASFAEHPEKFPSASCIVPVYAKESGFIGRMHTEEIGMVSLMLGGGRETKESKIDYTAGIHMCKKIGDPIHEGEILAYLHTNRQEQQQAAAERLLAAISVTGQRQEAAKHVYAIVAGDGITLM